VRAKFSVQVHHVDPDFYRRFQSVDGEPVAITPAVRDHFAAWHEGEADPTGGAS
jgi:hypothetical protein